ncbi:DNA double-strand break repair nuclease NurA [Acidianus brierleyi]|uniref:NurA domain-containing protein n=1 Tax=Acidianus brierleyi TaxID=41673 RepID=A0A2U9IBN8_9CREN|nr:DNA double-strand break repair nuclease NurA [Acidianus brierleyi]AWR93437.1 hypothetical protein DFR85_01260 [Acidianus brierleyi]
MIDKAYKELAENYDNLKNQLKTFYKNIGKEVSNKVKEIWIPYTPKSSIKKYLAIDGGEFVKEMRVGTIFIVNAEAILSNGINSEPIDTYTKVGVFRPGNLAKERVSELMATVETKLALKNSDKSDFILMDGSFNKKLNKGKGIESNLEYSLDDINSLKFYDENEMYKSLIVEKQITISKLINELDKRVLWISKTSRSRDIFLQQLSDLVILETFTYETGYTLPVCKRINQDDLVTHPLVNLSDFNVCTSFIRLKNGKKILRLDIVSKDKIEEKYIQQIIDNLSPVSIKGYPYPLLKVHYDVKVNIKDRERITRMLGLSRSGVDWWPNQFF